jgi:hypothetical protein
VPRPRSSDGVRDLSKRTRSWRCSLCEWKQWDSTTYSTRCRSCDHQRRSKDSPCLELRKIIGTRLPSFSDQSPSISLVSPTCTLYPIPPWMARTPHYILHGPFHLDGIVFSISPRITNEPLIISMRTYLEGVMLSPNKLLHFLPRLLREHPALSPHILLPPPPSHPLLQESSDIHFLRRSLLSLSKHPIVRQHLHRILQIEKESNRRFPGFPRECHTCHPPYPLRYPAPLPHTVHHHHHHRRQIPIKFMAFRISRNMSKRLLPRPRILPTRLPQLLPTRLCLMVPLHPTHLGSSVRL